MRGAPDQIVMFSISIGFFLVPLAVLLLASAYLAARFGVIRRSPGAFGVGLAVAVATVRLSILWYSLRVLWPHSDERQQYGHLLLVLNSLPEMVLVSHWRDSPAIWEILLSTAVLSSSIGLAAFWTKMTVWFQQSLQASGR